jgi:hypothetical protein
MVKYYFIGNHFWLGIMKVYWGGKTRLGMDP